MDWHILTSSKGGVGKTLISLMLLESTRRNKGVLVIDLNGVNADLRRLATMTNLGNAPPVPSLKWDIGRFYVDSAMKKRNYLVCWPEDSFKTIGAEDFTKLLSKISVDGKQEIEDKFQLQINTIIIDTNYHFCNLFSGQEKDYQHDLFQNFFKREDENVFIWFIWVYRQLSNLVEAFEDQNDPRNVDANTVKERAFRIETNIINNKLGSQEGSPFVHVFSPISIGQQVFNATIKSKFYRWIKAESSNKNLNYIIPLQKIAQLPKGKSINFLTFVINLRDAVEKASQEADDARKMGKEENVHQFFLRILNNYKAIQKNSRNGCPSNVMPLYIYHKDLLGYTEDNLLDVFEKIPNLEIYRDNFTELYNRLLCK